jgi:hypothetical protein
MPALRQRSSSFTAPSMSYIDSMAMPISRSGAALQ